MKKSGLLSLLLIFGASSVSAQVNDSITQSVPILSEADVAAQESCLATMAGFPNDNVTARYQFFKLTEMMAVDATDEFRSALSQYGEGQVSADTPLLEIIDGIANPVLRQAMPSLTVAQSAYLINFAVDCKKYVDGQMISLIAVDPDLASAEFNEIISEDALFLRQVLSDSLFRLGANVDPVFGNSIEANARALVRSRDLIEYASFDTSVTELESLYMDDLDGRLARVNELINSEMDREIFDTSVALADDMSEATRQEQERAVVRTLYGILNSY